MNPNGGHKNPRNPYKSQFHFFHCNFSFFISVSDHPIFATTCNIPKTNNMNSKIKMICRTKETIAQIRDTFAVFGRSFFQIK